MNDLFKLLETNAPGFYQEISNFWKNIRPIVVNQIMEAKIGGFTCRISNNVFHIFMDAAITKFWYVPKVSHLKSC